MDSIGSFWAVLCLARGSECQQQVSGVKGSVRGIIIPKTQRCCFTVLMVTRWVAWDCCARFPFSHRQCYKGTSKCLCWAPTQCLQSLSIARWCRVLLSWLWNRQEWGRWNPGTAGNTGEAQACPPFLSAHHSQPAQHYSRRAGIALMLCETPRLLNSLNVSNSPKDLLIWSRSVFEGELSELVSLVHPSGSVKSIRTN